jgi:hypothetical protein
MERTEKSKCECEFPLIESNCCSPWCRHCGKPFIPDTEAKECKERGQHCWNKGTGHNCATCCFCGQFKNHPEHKLDTEEKIKKAIYQSILDFSNDLRKDIKLYFSDRIKYVEGKPYEFSDIFYKEEFSRLLFDYIDDKITKEDFKFRIQAKIAYAHSPGVLGGR